MRFMFSLLCAHCIRRSTHQSERETPPLSLRERWGTRLAHSRGCTGPGSGMIAIEGENRVSKELVRETPSCQDIAERGEAIYGEKYRAELEKTSNGKFIAINVANADATIADTGEDAIRLALEKDPAGSFHLIRVRHKAAFAAGWYISCAR